MRSASLAALFLVIAPAAVAAGDLLVEAKPCAATVRVKATDVPIEEVLARLSTELKFTLTLKAPLKAPVSLDRTDTAENLIKDLMRGHNLVLDTKPLAACKGREGIAKVWVLPAGQAVEARREGLAWNPALDPRRHPRFGRRHNNLSNEEWKRLTAEWKAGRIVADPETGKPIAAEQAKSQDKEQAK